MQIWPVFLAVWIVWVGVTPIAKRCCEAQIALAEPPSVVSVHPSSISIPENLLRISIVFASPAAESVLPQIALQHSNAAVIEAPFLEQELWSPDGKTLTLLLHPGRVKTGLIAHNEFGRAIVKETSVALVVNHHVVKQWQVEGEDRAASDPTHWSVTTPRAGTRDALQIAFEAPIDALSSHKIAIVASENIKITGKTALATGEKAWTFLPRTQWKRGTYRILVYSRLEDASGNEVREPFEHAISSKDVTDSSTIAIPILIN